LKGGTAHGVRIVRRWLDRDANDESITDAGCGWYQVQKELVSDLENHMKRDTTFGMAALLAVTLASTSAFAAGEQPAEESSWTSESDWDIPGEYVVDFRDDVEESTIASLLGSLGLSYQPTELSVETRIEVVSLSGGSALDQLRADGRVEAIEPHARVRAMFVPNDPMFDQQWHMTRIGAEQAWGLSIGRGVTVAVVDTGIACEDFGDFKKATDLNLTRCVDGYNFVKGGKHANDDHGHGTHVAGTIAQSTNNGVGVAGLAFGARLMPVKVLSANGWGTTTGVADGIRWAADHGAQVINLSLGGPRNSAVLQAAVNHARSRGALVVASAGNSGGRVGYPGACEGAVGVSATDRNDSIAWFSSRGKGVDIAAPGVSVVQQTICDRGRGGCEVFPAFNGTSMSSPHVSGVAAMLVGLGVTDPDALEKTLYATAKSIDDSDKGRANFGHGLLQASAATSRTVLVQLLTRFATLIASFLIALRWARKRGSPRLANPGLWLGALVTGVGLLCFAPWFLSRDALWVDLLSRPFGEWDLLIGASLHRFLPLANVFLPLALALVFLRSKVMSPWAAGFSIGTGGYLASIAVLGQHGTPFGWFLTTAWCALHALGCVYLGSLMLDRR
jgi:serine protease